jgi:cytochrome c peroxidase
MRRGLWIVILLLVTQQACRKEPAEPIPPAHVPVPYVLEWPTDFPPMIFRSDNPLTEEGVALGRRLYYDPILHPDSLMACAGCHRQDHAFGLPGTSVLPHINLGWNQVYLWGGASAPIFGDMEEVCRFEVEAFFGTDLEKIRRHPMYREMFRKAFGRESITSKDVAYALAQFMRTQVSGASRYDRMLGHHPDRLWPSDEELKGYEIFFSEKGDCFHCHGSVFFTDNRFHNIGLNADFNGLDRGLYQWTGNAADLGKFKTPTLRNVGLRDHFMHDGRFRTLEEVVRFYNEGVRHSITLDPIMTKPGKQHGLGLKEEEIAALVAFLHTLTDTAFLQNPRLGDPFR